MVREVRGHRLGKRRRLFRPSCIGCLALLCEYEARESGDLQAILLGVAVTLLTTISASALLSPLLR